MSIGSGIAIAGIALACAAASFSPDGVALIKEHYQFVCFAVLIVFVLSIFS